MKTIRINKDAKDELDRARDEISPNKFLKWLMKKSEPPVMVECSPESFNIHVDGETLEELKRFKKYSNDTHSDVILRLIKEYNSQ